MIPLIYSYLHLSYRTIIETQQRIKDLFEVDDENIKELYEEDLPYYRTPGDVEHIYNVLSLYMSSKQKMWEIYQKAVFINQCVFDELVSELVDVVGTKYAGDSLYDAVMNGGRLFSRTSGEKQIAAFRYLHKYLEGEAAAKFLKKTPKYLSCYDSEDYWLNISQATQLILDFKKRIDNHAENLTDEVFITKLLSMGVDHSAAQRLIEKYKSVHLVNRYLDGELNDDNFKALSEIFQIFYMDKEIDVNDLLDYRNASYMAVQNTRNTIKALFNVSDEQVMDVYRRDKYTYLQFPIDAKAIYSEISKYIELPEKQWIVFKNLFCDCSASAQRIIKSIVLAVGKDSASDLICDLAVSGYLVRNYFENAPEDGIIYLRSFFDEETTAKVLREHPEILYYFKVSYCEQTKEEKEKIGNIIKKYKN